MTREEAIKYLNEFILFKKISNTTEREAVECFKLAIEALQQQPSENEKIIRISKGTLKARTGRYVIYDVEWLKEHFNTTEAKIYGQSKAEGTRGGIPLQQSVPEMPQPKTGHWFLSGGYWRCSECKEKALLKLDKATGGYREYEPVRSKYCPECGAKMQEVKK